LSLDEKTKKRLNAQCVGVRDTTAGAKLGAVYLGWTVVRLCREMLRWGSVVLSWLFGSEDLEWAAGLTFGSKALNQGGSMHKHTEKICKI
jgi:hypothetical protein